MSNQLGTSSESNQFNHIKQTDSYYSAVSSGSGTATAAAPAEEILFKIARSDTIIHEFPFSVEKWVIINLSEFNEDKAVEWIKTARKEAMLKKAGFFRVVVFTNSPHGLETNTKFDAINATVRRYKGTFDDALVLFEAES